MRKIKSGILLALCSLGMVSCTSYSNYSYAIEGHPQIATPTVFPDTDSVDNSYKTRINENTVEFYNSFWFSSNSATLDSSESNFALVAKYNTKYLLDNPDATIQINGYSSELGNTNKNMQLAKQRANFIKSYLIANGVNSDQIKVKALGSNVELYPNSPDKNNMSNRRVDIIYTMDQPKEYAFDSVKGIIVPKITIEKRQLEIERD